MVRTHPVSGKKALFVNGNFTTRINGLSKLESDALLQMLCRHAETAEFQCRFSCWQKRTRSRSGDNRCVQHHAMWDYFLAAPPYRLLRHGRGRPAVLDGSGPLPLAGEEGAHRIAMGG